MRRIITLSFVLVLLGINLSAGNPDFLTVLGRKNYVFINKKCTENNSCSLKNVKYLVENYTILLTENEKNSTAGKFDYGTRLYASYETDSVETLEDYVFVQFIKGCVYYSHLEGSKVIPTFEIFKPHLDSYILFKFKDWAIDSFRDKDPVYSTVPGFSRHAGLRWNNTGYFVDDDMDETLYKDAKPPVPILYTTDRGSIVSYSSKTGIAKNYSMEMRMCVYKTKDVPTEVELYDTNFAKPIHCYTWSSSWIYNFKKGRYENPKGIASACK